MKSNRFRLNADYWDQKLANYLHDPPDKALHIPGHEERSQVLLEALGDLPSPVKEFYSTADQIAAGMDRAQLAGYSENENKNGAIDFAKWPLLTHPTGKENPLQLDVQLTGDRSGVASDIAHIIQTDLEDKNEGLADRFQGDKEGFAAARFHYVHHVLRDRLAKENVAGLGGAWYRMPADTRIPDHSIWQHCALVSALCSCFHLSQERQASLMVFSITPVQDFIGSARKLRDFWTGSVLLSWLAFEGIRHVIYHYGADHILYPSLIGQPMVNRLFAKECGLTWLHSKTVVNPLAGVASLPNKFVILVPKGQEKDAAQRISQSIQEAWLHLGRETLSLLEKKTHREDSYLRVQFKRQMSTFWNFQWAACPLLIHGATDQIKQLLSQSAWENPLNFARPLLVRNDVASMRTEGVFYGPTHALAQAFLAAGKGHRTDLREEEPGIKCSLHGDMEALRFSWKDAFEDHNPRPSQDPFWSLFKEKWEPPTDFTDTERLSSIALVKRLAYRVAKKASDHPLNPLFEDAERFPSSTEMALSDWLDRVAKYGFHETLGENWRAKLAQYLHEDLTRAEGADVSTETELTENDKAVCRKILRKAKDAGNDPGEEDRYYAILVMDGDKMGKLVNGETLASTWNTTLHPELVKRLNSKAFDTKQKAYWEEKLDLQRLLAPAIHASISESLGDFSLHLVPQVIHRCRGRLIYAGGDDVCAILPVSTAISAAREIARLYNSAFLFIPAAVNEAPKTPQGTWKPEPGRLAVNLGAGKDISISGAISIVHHKKPLQAAMRQAHALLKRAKEEGGRNCLGIELDKRSGGSRSFLAKWDAQVNSELLTGKTVENEQESSSPSIWDNFLSIACELGSPANRVLSSSLVYRLEDLKPGLEALLKNSPQDLRRFLASLIKRNLKKMEESQVNLLARHVAALIVSGWNEKKREEISTKPLLIARFVGASMARTASAERSDA
ncbi:MAG: type III-B CRISPR-associated protein Cas10/Cmr2 [Deltaproteobacteria bacterium]|jgi:CRISPR-associated protein Cmr2|nr:type III-B CRISPR-associated protein Cas10/Cmr2 [Deltaproteobacteria bacterium]